MDNQPYSSDSEQDGHRPPKRARHSPPPSKANGNGHPPERSLPPLSLSILGVEPLDEFIRDVADWVQHVVTTRQERTGSVEVEAKIGVLKDANGQRLSLPVTTEASTCINVLCHVSELTGVYSSPFSVQGLAF